MPPEAYSDGNADAIMSRLVKVFRRKNVIFVKYQRRHSKWSRILQKRGARMLMQNGSAYVF